MEKAGVNYIVPVGLDPFFEREFAGWEPETFAVFMEQPCGSVAWDLGAWIGVTARWLSDRFDTVVAFEPDALAAEKARILLDANGCRNVGLRRAAVVGDDSPANLLLASRGDWGNSQSFLSPTGAVEVETVRVYDIQPRPDFIKCDIEGGEQYLLSDLLSLGVPCLVSFHLSWWDRRLPDLEPYNGRAKACGARLPDVRAYIEANPFCSVYFA